MFFGLLLIFGCVYWVWLFGVVLLWWCVGSVVGVVVVLIVVFVIYIV